MGQPSMTVLLSLLASIAAAAECDLSCAPGSCSTRVEVKARPCDGRGGQDGWSLGDVDESTGLRQILFVDLCVTWNQNTLGLDLLPCASENGARWPTATVRDCQQFRFDGAGGAIRAPLCESNEGALDGCLDVHGKVGPGVQLTRCYGQPNDNFTLVGGRWASRDAPPTYPGRCMVPEEAVCAFASCCTACAEGLRRDEDGFCREATPPRKTANVFLAGPTNQTGLDAVLAHLKAHRRSFTGIIYQYLAICGDLDGHKYHYCADGDNVGPPHLGEGHPSGAIPDLAAQFRAALGADLELFPIVSYGDTTDTTLLDALFTNETLAAKFAEDALAYVERHNLTGLNWDVEPTGDAHAPWIDATRPFLARITETFRAAGKRLTWDSNGPEAAFPFDLDAWIAMTTYYGGTSYQRSGIQGISAVGPDKFGLGYCPTCQVLNESAVEARFQWLTVPPGDSVREIDLWATYAMDAGDDYFADWDFYWPRLEAWLQD